MKRRTGCALLIIAGMLAGSIGEEWIADRIDRQRFPWGYANSGKPTLVGTWVGRMTTGSGKRLGVLIEMDLAPLNRGDREETTVFRTRSSDWLEGRELVCDGKGLVRRYRVSGKPEDSGPSRFRLATISPDNVQQDGLTPSTMNGRWDGGDALSLDVSLYLRQGKSAITNTADPDTGRDTPLMMTRGTQADFDSLCGRL